MAPGACKIRREYNVFQFPIQNYASRDTKVEDQNLMACLWRILRDEYQAVVYIPLRYSSPMLNHSYLPTPPHCNFLLPYNNINISLIWIITL